MNENLYVLEDAVLDELIGKFVTIIDPEKRKTIISTSARALRSDITSSELEEIVADIGDLSPITELIQSETIEDIMINDTTNIFVFDSKGGHKKLELKIKDRETLERFVNKLKLYATNESSAGHVMDVHLPTGSRANIVSSPRGYDITIRNFKKNALSILDLINLGELDYSIAARLWLYMDGFRVRPANLIIGGVPASGKTTLLNALFSFFRPEQRIVTIEETYELNTITQENCVNLETSEDLPLVDLVKNALRMRPDMIIIGEVRGEEANDMITAMNIGKICIGTIHASSSRDIINRLQHSPMNVPRDIIPVIDAMVVLAPVYSREMMTRKVVQISEISGIETQILLSDLFKFDYRTHRAAPMLPSIAYRDSLSQVTGIPPPDILAEESVRAAILMQLNKQAKTSIRSLNEVVKGYYTEPDETLRKLGLGQLHPIVYV